jgi:hypothetical protein
MKVFKKWVPCSLVTLCNLIKTKHIISIPFHKQLTTIMVYIITYEAFGSDIRP